MTNTDADGMLPMTGKSIRNILESSREGTVNPLRQYVFSGRERHSSSRYQNWGYPQRAIRDQNYLLIWNIKPDRWPAGAPQAIDPDHENELLPLYGIDQNGVHHPGWAFTDVGATPTKSYLVDNLADKEIWPFFRAAFEKNPEILLYDIKSDPDCMNNLADDPDFAEIKKEMQQELINELKET
ncbi:MAG: hypothetical protein WD431_09660 [Cyclobacteriaceae bacterium]